jgi:Protein of unknown function (DUF3467)
MADEKQPAQEQTPAQPAAAEQAQPRQQIQIDEKGAVTMYANFCRVTGTPEEMIIDFGLNAQPHGTPTEPVAVNQRIVTNYFTAKRLLHALAMSVQRHEQAFGVLETDVQKRAQRGQRA